MVSKWQRSKTCCAPSPISTHMHKKKKNLLVKGLTQNNYWTRAENLKPPKRAIKHPHNWVEQKKKEREWNWNWTSTPERDLWKRKGTCTLGSHLIDREIRWNGRTSNSQRKVPQLEEGKEEKEAHRPLVPPPGTPQPETLRRGLGTETQAPEVGSGERTRFGSVETAWGAREHWAKG